MNPSILNKFSRYLCAGQKILRISVRKQSGFKHFGPALVKVIWITNQEVETTSTTVILLYEANLC